MKHFPNPARKAVSNWLSGLFCIVFVQWFLLGFPPHPLFFNYLKTFFTPDSDNSKNNIKSELESNWTRVKRLGKRLP